MSPTNIGIDKVTGTLSKWITNMVKMHPGKKLYALLWLFAGITLIVEIGFQIAWANNKDNADQANAIAAVLIVFVIALFAAITTTIIVSMRLRRAKPKTATSTTIKQGGKK